MTRSLSALRFVSENPERVNCYFANLLDLCRQVTKIAFKLQKHDIYVAGREDPKLNLHCPQLLHLASAARKIACAYRSQAMSGVKDMCAALCAGHRRLARHAMNLF